MTTVANVQTLGAPSEQVSANVPAPASVPIKEKPKLISGYLAFACICFTVGDHYSERDYSSVLTLSGGFQMLGLILLRIYIQWRGTVAGISGKTMILHAAACIFRLSSTTWLSGYIPTDQTGNWVYQATDVLCLLAALSIIHAIFRSFRSTYDEEKDEKSPAVHTITMLAFFLATMAHGDLNDRPLFDMAWFAGFYLDCFAVVPQLCLLWQCARRSEAVITSHYVWPTVLRVGLSYSFFFYAFSELTPEDCPNCVNYVGYALITMHSLQLVFVVALAALKLEKSLPEPDQKTATKLLGAPLVAEAASAVPALKPPEVELSVQITQQTTPDLEAPTPIGKVSI